jgi:predicted ArsR family transcriptional regulator
MWPDVSTTTTKKGKPMTTWHYQEVAMSDFESQDVTPLLQSLDELEEVIDRSEHNGLFSEDAKLARREFEDICLKLNCLIMRKVKLQKWLGAAEKTSE